MRNKKIYGTILGTMAIALVFTGCGNKKKITYGNTKGSATGTINLSGNGAEIDVDNIKADAGTDIDYTSGLEIKADDDDDYEVEVNATNVKNDTPGTYNVDYRVTNNGKTYTKGVKVTIVDGGGSSASDNTSGTGNGTSDTGSGAAGADSASGTSNSGSSSSGSTNSGNGSSGNTNSGGSNSGSTNSGSANTGNTSGGSTNSGSTNSGSTNKSTTSTERVLKDGGNKTVIANKNLDNAVIELLSGDVVTIKCTTKKYITSTRTDESTVNKNGHNYKVSKLVIVFNTGEERTLETIEKKID